MLLDVRNLKIYFDTDNGIIKSVDDIDFGISQGESVAIVGESGSGKTVTSLSIISLLKDKNIIKSGEIIFNGVNILELNEKQMQNIRGREISMIFQEPMTVLNPALKVGYQISEVYIRHFNFSKTEARNKSIEILKSVNINNPEIVYRSYPFELSGGMRQRVMIAMAIASKPKLLIADEPTTALDVTVEHEIILLLKKLKREFNTSLLFISHDLSIVSEVADYVNVMYAGKIVESGRVKDIFKNPKHPYTRGLIKARPVIGNYDRLYEIKGQIENPTNFKDNCRFCNRCQYKMSVCEKKVPEMIDYDGHKVACFLYSEGDNNERIAKS